MKKITLTKKKVLTKLEEVLDPEIGVSIVDLGLIYKVIIIEGKLKIVMTLTTIGCPLFSIIEDQTRSKLRELGLKDKDIQLELTFDPPWDMEMMSERGKAMLGI